MSDLNEDYDQCYREYFRPSQNASELMKKLFPSDVITKKDAEELLRDLLFAILRIGDYNTSEKIMEYQNTQVNVIF